jgi:hypothetical protein
MSVPTIEERPDLWVMMQDSSMHCRIVGGDTVDARDIAPAYRFSMLYDSSCLVTYLLSEWRLNDRLLPLKG